ncbi:3-isopropylmalate dehydratase small subunit [Novosphingobium sp. PC22D]|uniref:3-isopropylmalate dehydratase small subunit n=1 Tax=Novosphingobium sp. PC22D TaxID=1962403 RepID=UPI000BF082AF|nr:3-isopropylmalate dehydratase small subunit [Novosphingobium sp. PC22D]PEQ11378.1 3-isopropylmalate dehydratase small subunit [Novosphingobium sp. PC22D]
MEPLTIVTSTAVPLIRDNIDTDIIIPSREMRTVGKKGLGDGLFANWRYTDAATRTPDPGFVLNKPESQGAQILLGGRNFGSGSSREHAVWALAEYGFRVVIAESFSPIFHGNCIRNGLLPVVLDPAPLARPGLEITVDLPAQKVRAEGRNWSFEIDGEHKTILVNGLDPIGMTLELNDRIVAHERADRHARAWAWSVLQAES